MNEKLQDLREFAEQYYWNHTTKFRFITVMANGFYQQMVLPEKFVKYSKEKLSENVVLKGPSGNLWLVKLLKVQGDSIFIDGWKEFVEAHNVEEGDILSFEYEGYSCLNVLIYDARNQCERETSYLARNQKNIIADTTCLPKKRSVEDSAENLHTPSPHNNYERHSPRACSDDNPHVEQLSPPSVPDSNGMVVSKPLDTEWGDGRRKVRKSERTVHAENMQKHLAQNNYENHSPKTPSGDDPQAQQLSPQNFSASNRKTAAKSPIVGLVDDRRKIGKDVSTSKGKKGRPKKRVPGSAEQNAIQTSTNDRPMYEVQLISNRRPVTNEEKDTALQHASKMKPARPFFRIVMRDTHVYRRHFMTIPVDFVAEYIHPQFETVDLRIANGQNTWPNVCLKQQKSSLGLSGALWRNFVQDNNLEEGDVCVFERTNSEESLEFDVPEENLAFDVYIFRVVDEVTPHDKRSIKK